MRFLLSVSLLLFPLWVLAADNAPVKAPVSRKKVTVARERAKKHTTTAKPHVKRISF